jgi:hypothetical protein
LHIPVFRNIFFGPKKPFLPGFLRIFFPVFSGGIFYRNVVLEVVAGIPVFFATFTGIFHRNSCGTGIPVFTQDSSGFLRIPPDSSGFLFSPNAVWLRPAGIFSPN